MSIMIYTELISGSLNINTKIEDFNADMLVQLPTTWMPDNICTLAIKT